ncbi:unnamed protein product [Mytilus coruscus]|uniref:Uncharacterized protein n=1 Tax=Mytilus coruscus TaxID=42192 RepID=A0A6J8ET28_MYTCO|nr:unnamed protein product [Mytilus coruscus]
MKFEKDVAELGKIEVKFSSSKKVLLQKEKREQIFVPISNTLENIKLTNIRSFQTPTGTSKDTFITGIDMFYDGKIVLADESKCRLAITNQEGELIKTVQLGERCYDVAVIDKDTVATTLFLKRKVVIIDVNSAKVQRNLPTKDYCHGIISTGEQLVVSLYNKTIQLFDLSGNALSTSSTAADSGHCSVLNDKLYYTTYKSGVVYSTTLDGEVRWKFDCQKSDYPTGITNDTSGNIFVACRDSNQLTVVGQDGEKSRVLLTEEE